MIYAYIHTYAIERKPLAYACELDRIDAAVLLLESGASEESFHKLPEIWKRDYVKNWLEDRALLKRRKEEEDQALIASASSLSFDNNNNNNNLLLPMPSTITRATSNNTVLNIETAKGLVGVQVYVRGFNNNNSSNNSNSNNSNDRMGGGDRVGTVIGYCIDRTRGILHEVELKGSDRTSSSLSSLSSAADQAEDDEEGEEEKKHEKILLSYVEVLSGHIAYFNEFGTESSFVPLVAYRKEGGGGSN
jgi:hypothetical protein